MSCLILFCRYDEYNTIENDFLIIVTNNDPNKAIEVYAIRWEIESMFGCLKSKGFYFEDTHITDRDRIKKLIVVLAVAYCWAYKTGEWRHHNEKVISLKKHGRPQYSWFRYGLDWIVNKIIQRGQKLRRLCKLFEQIFAAPLGTSLTQVVL